MLKIKLSISACCALTLFFILFCFNGIEIFSNHQVWFGVIAYSFIMFENIDNFTNQLIIEKDNEEIKDDGFLRKELNHKNLNVRKYYRSKQNSNEYFGAYLFTLFFPFFILMIPFKDTKFGDNIHCFLFDNKLIEWLFEIKARKVISSEEITENHKVYTVLTYLDGKKVYKYNNKTHREIGAASFYPKEYFTFSNYRDKYFIHGKQVSIDKFEKSKIQHNCENF